MLDIFLKSITPMNFQKFNGFLKHRKEIMKNLKHGEHLPGAICDDPECPYCLEYLKRMRVKDGHF